MDKATVVKGALKARKSGKSKTAQVAVVNTPTVKIDHSEDTPVKMPPTLRLTTDDLPAIKGWKVGQTYKVQLEIQMKGIRQGSMYEMVDAPDDKKTSADFKVTSVRSA